MEEEVKQEFNMMQREFIKWNGDDGGVTGGFELTKCVESKGTLPLSFAQHILWRIVGRTTCPPWARLEWQMWIETD